MHKSSFISKKKNRKLLTPMNAGAGAFPMVPSLTALDSKAAGGGSSCSPSRGRAPQVPNTTQTCTQNNCLKVHTAFKITAAAYKATETFFSTSSKLWPCGLGVCLGETGRWEERQLLAPKPESTFPCSSLHCHPNGRGGSNAITPQFQKFLKTVAKSV